jgi:hypothetical protein
MAVVIMTWEMIRYSETSEIRLPSDEPNESLDERCPHFRVQFALRTAVWDQIVVPETAVYMSFCNNVELRL